MQAGFAGGTGPSAGAMGALELTGMQWWLLPFWSKEARIKYATFNARAETVASSASFREPFRRRRCLIPACGWYEWQQIPGGKQPWFFQAADGALLAFAGLRDRWQSDGEVIDSCTIIVGDPPSTLRDVHDRMAFLIPRAREVAWLPRDLTDAAEVRALLQPAAAGALSFHRVGKAVGNARNDGPELIAPSSAWVMNACAAAMRCRAPRRMRLPE